MKILLLIILFSLNYQSYAQDPRNERFVVQVTHFTPPFENAAEVRCAGTIVSSSHVLTAASCVTPILPTQIVGIRLVLDTSTIFYRVIRVSIHPSYRTGQNGHANMAIILVSELFITSTLPLLPVAGLPSNLTCNLFGWGQQTLNARRDAVSIYGPEFCDPTLPQVSCSTFASVEHETCSASLGSPVLCDENSRFTGFVTTDGCLSDGTRATLSYHSINAYRTWINEVFRADSFDPFDLSTNFVANVMELVQGNVGTARLRCVGTIITENHLLTTASCVILPTDSQQTIGVQALWSNLGWRTVQAQEVSIHPNFVATQNRVANVAVIRSSLSFPTLNNQRPRLLGELPTINETNTNFCHLVGWANTREFFLNRVVAVYRPELCNPNLPQVFCSIIDVGSQETCTAWQGSPVMCGNGSLVSGFLLNNRACGAVGTLNALDYHSVGEFREWIEEVTAGATAAKISMFVILSMALISAKNLL